MAARQPSGHFGGRPQEPLPDADADAEELKTILGQNISNLRKQQRMAVRALAEQVGVSAAFISQVEHGAATPSVPTLVRIAQALRAKIGDLFDAAPGHGQIVRSDERPAYEYPDRGITEAQVSSDPSGSLEVLWIKLEPGGGTGPELFTHGADTEFVMILKGRVAITVGDVVHELAAGDSVTFPGKDLHGSQNLSRGSSELIWVQTPASY